MAASTRILSLILRGISIGLLIYLITIFSLLVNPKIFNFWEVANVLGQLRDLFSYIFYMVLYGIFMGIFYMFGALFSMGFSANFDAYFFFNTMSVMFSNIVGRWFYFDALETNSPTFSQAFGGFRTLALSMLQDTYMVSLQLVIAFMFLFALRATITANPGDSIKTVVLLNVVIIIPLFVEQIVEIVHIFVSTTPAILQSMLDEEVLKDAIYADVSDNIGTFLTSPIFTVAVICFLYLEFTFQMSYIDKVSKPALEREARLSRQIAVLKDEAERAIQNIKAMEEKKREQRMLELSMKSVEEQLEEKKRLSLRSFMSTGSSGSAFTYISELIEKKKKEKEEKERLSVLRDTRKLAHYLEKLFRQDPEAKSNLTAKTSAPSAAGLLRSTVINTTTRIILIIILTWAAIHPYYIFVNVFRAPPAIAESVELQTYEGVLSLLIPILLLIPLTATLIKVTKHNKLQEMLRLEELKRRGLTEEELAELEEKRRKELETSDDIDFDKDQDAAAAQAAKQTQSSPNTP